MKQDKKLQGYHDKHKLSLAFSNFAKYVSSIVGNAITFLLALLSILIWLTAGPFFHYSDTWQLVVNTATTIVTFLVVFLIQHTQNRDTEILNLKIDELIKGQKNSSNNRIDLSSLSDEALQELEKEYNKLCAKRKNK